MVDLGEVTVSLRIKCAVEVGDGVFEPAASRPLDLRTGDDLRITESGGVVASGDVGEPVKAAPVAGLTLLNGQVVPMDTRSLDEAPRDKTLLIFMRDPWRYEDEMHVGTFSDRYWRGGINSGILHPSFVAGWIALPFFYGRDSSSELVIAPSDLAHLESRSFSKSELPQQFFEPNTRLEE